MDIDTIRTERDYEAACRRIDEIFQAEPGTPEERELDTLVTMVDAYEEERFPMGNPHPIEALKVQMEALGVTEADLMERLNKSRGGVADILEKRRALSHEDIRTLSELLRLPVGVLGREYPLECGGQIAVCAS
jgi:HTH-type transcriptional regulator / antitoxin HigA